MPKLEYFVAAESLSVDLDRNSVSVFHILNEVQLREIPGVLPQLAVASAWVFDEQEIQSKSECQVKFELRPPGDGEVKVFRSNMSAEVRFQNMHLQIQNVPIATSGDLIVRVFLDDEERATHTIEVSSDID